MEEAFWTLPLKNARVRSNGKCHYVIGIECDLINWGRKVGFVSIQWLYFYTDNSANTAKKERNYSFGEKD